MDQQTEALLAEISVENLRDKVDDILTDYYVGAQKPAVDHLARFIIEQAVAMRDACFKDMLTLIKHAHEDTPGECHAQEALTILYDSVAQQGPEGFGLELPAPPKEKP